MNKFTGHCLMLHAYQQKIQELKFRYYFITAILGIVLVLQLHFILLMPLCLALSIFHVLYSVIYFRPKNRDLETKKFY